MPDLRKRFFRFGAWTATLSVLFSVVLGPFVPLAQAAFDEPTTTETSPHDVVLNEFVSDNHAGSPEFIELYNRTDQTVDLSDWTLTTSRKTIHTFPHTSLASHAYVAETFTLDLKDADDTLRLLNDQGRLIDELAYGSGPNARIAAPSEGLAAARRDDGSENWFTNLAPTRGTTNGPVPSLARPLALSVHTPSGVPANTVNIESASKLQLSITLAETTQATDQVTFLITDQDDRSRDITMVGAAGGGTFVTTPIDLTDSPHLADGPLTLRAFVTNSQGTSTQYLRGVTVSKDTEAPSRPHAISLVDASGEPVSFVNSQTAGSLKPLVRLPLSASATDQVLVELHDGIHTVSQLFPVIVGSAGTIATEQLLTQKVDPTNLQDGSIEITASLVDAAGNKSSQVAGDELTKDTSLPTASLVIDDGRTVTNQPTVHLTITGSDNGTIPESMRIATTSEFARAGVAFQPFRSSATFTLPGEGNHTLFLETRDEAGNVSPVASATILFDRDAEQIQLVPLATGTQTVQALPVEVTITATAPTTLTFATYKTNPGTALPTGVTGLGKFVEVGLADPTKISFPVTVRLYYTLADLAQAGITSEQQLTGLGFFNQTTHTWELFSSTGVSTSDVIVANQPFAGFLFANADHLTPITGFADTTAPVAPVNLSTKTADGSVSLSWASVPDAVLYLVRYRVSGNPTAPFTTVMLPANTTSTTITNLLNGTTYEFGVASQDSQGNLSAFATTFATPAPIPAPVRVANQEPQIGSSRIVTGVPVTPLTRRTPTPTIQPSVTPSPSPSVTPTTSPSPTPTPGAEEKAKNISRLLLTLAVLILALGAGTLGFYGYQWWATRPTKPTSTPPRQDGPTPPPTPPTPPAAQPIDQPAPKAPEAPKPPEKPPEGRW